MVNESAIIRAIRQSDNIITPSLVSYRCVSDVNNFPPVKFIPGGYCLSFPLECPRKTSKCLRLWYKNNGHPENPSHIVKVSNFFNENQVKYVIPYKYVNPVLKLADGTQIPGVVMEWIEGSTLMRFVKDNYKDKNTILKLAEKFYEMAKYHSEHGMAHGDLSDENIIVKPDGELLLIDYDSFYVVNWDKTIPQPTVGVEWYQHPDRMNGRNLCLNTSMDYFSQQVIYLSLLVIAEKPSLFKKDTEKGLLFKQGDFKNSNSFNSSTMYKEILKIPNPEIRRRLDELGRAISGPLNKVKSIVEIEQPIKYKIRMKVQDPVTLFPSQSLASVGENIRIIYVNKKPNEYKIKGINLITSNGVRRLGNQCSFQMPNSDVTLEAEIEKIAIAKQPIICANCNTYYYRTNSKYCHRCGKKRT